MEGCPERVPRDCLARAGQLRAGAASTRVWLRAAHRDTPPLRLHQVFSVLPGAAVYTALTEHGDTNEDATRTLHHALTAMARPRARLYQRLTATDRGRRLFMKAAVVASPRLFPDPGWHAQWRARTPGRAAFDMTRCYDLDMLRLLDAAAIAPAYCAVDDTHYGRLHPQIRWQRTGTLATGSTRCDFCFTHQAAAAAG